MKHSQWFEDDLHKNAPGISRAPWCVSETWQGQKESNPRHAVLETAALPAELYPYMVGLPFGRAAIVTDMASHADRLWWAFRDLNPGPTGYEPAALTN